MNTAPQDDYSGDLARDLSGWSNDALLKELSRRTTITTDAEHELVSTGAGLHLQHRKPNITVVYDAVAETFTVTIPTLTANLIHVGDGLQKFPHLIIATPLVFKKHTANYDVDIVANTQLDKLSQLFWVASIDHDTATDDATTLNALAPNLWGCTQNLTILSISLKTDGTSSHDWRCQKPDVWLPNLQRPGSLPYLTYDKDDRRVTLHNVQGRYGHNEQPVPFSTKSDPIPVSTASAYIYAGTNDYLTANLYFDGHPDIDDMHPHAAVVGRITTDADGRGLLEDWSCSMQFPINWAFTGEVTPDKKLTVTNGIISAITSTPAGVSDDVDVSTANTMYFTNGILTSHT